MASNSQLVDAMYDKVQKSLSQQSSRSVYKENIDKYLARNTEKYFTIGPMNRPIYSTTDMETYIEVCGLSTPVIKEVLKSNKNIKSNWYIMNDPFNIANALATRYFTLAKNDEFIKLTQWYLLVSLYPGMHYKYFKHGVNDSCMKYTINNLSDKYRIKQLKNLWTTLTEMIATAYNLHKDNIAKGEDVAFIKYVQDVHSRMNSLLKNIAVEYYDNHENQRFLQTEFESSEEENYREGDSNSIQVSKITNNVVNHLCVHGADMKLVQLAAKANNVSVNEMRNYCTMLIGEKYRSDIFDITESILFIYLFDADERHMSSDIGTNDFMYYCLKIYKKSNTKDKNIIRIKSVLDKWLKEVGVYEKTNRQSTILQFKRALYTFFVLSIQKYWR